VEVLIHRNGRSLLATLQARALLLLVLLVASPASDAAWFRGNTHAHTLSSDGNASPDVVRWYREHGYPFIA
jgi:hypothetical protein